MKYIGRDERQSRVLYLSQDFHQELYTFIQTKRQCFECVIVFYTYSTHLLNNPQNKQTDFFDKMCLLNHGSIAIATNFKPYGSYRTVELFDPPTQNTSK